MGRQLDAGDERSLGLIRHTIALLSPCVLAGREQDASADLLLIKGDPLKDISILTRSEEHFVLIMTDGKIYKNLCQ